MKRAWILLLLSACQAPARPEPARPAAGVADLEFERKVALQMFYDPLLVKQGDWALYTLKAQGTSRGEHYKWSAVSADAKGMWVENKVPHADTGMVVKTRYDRAGKTVEVWAGPPGGVPAQIWPMPGSPMTPPPAPAAIPAARETPEPLNAAGRVFRCLKVSSEAAYPDGRKVQVVSWFSPEVPFAGLARYGGLVKRQVGRVTFELVDAGSGSRPRPELDIPR
jgi:hypothetical protein